MNDIKKSLTVLIADDNPDDRFLIKEAWAESRLNNDLKICRRW